MLGSLKEFNLFVVMFLRVGMKKFFLYEKFFINSHISNQFLLICFKWKIKFIFLWIRKNSNSKHVLFLQSKLLMSTDYYAYEEDYLERGLINIGINYYKIKSSQVE